VCRGLAWSVVEPMNVAIRNVAAAEGIPLVDVYTALAADVPRYISADGLHPTELGDAKIAELFFQALRTSLEASPPSISSWFRRP